MVQMLQDFAMDLDQHDPLEQEHSFQVRVVSTDYAWINDANLSDSDADFNPDPVAQQIG